MAITLAGRTIAVTGAASGIGREATVYLRAAGAYVVGIDLNLADEADEFVEADLSEPGSIQELVTSLPEGLDGLCNIAGVAPTMPGELVLRVNTCAVRDLTEALAPRMANGASIVNLASMAGNGWRDNLDQVLELLDTDWEGIGEFVARHDIARGPRSYFLSKEAVIVWTMQKRWTWRDRDIRMNCVSPGPVETPILEDFLETLGDRAQESVRNMDRFGKPSDVAPVIAFLLSDEAAWFRGANVTPDGGMGAHLALKRYGVN